MDSWRIEREIPAADELGIGRDRARMSATLFFEDARGARLIWERRIPEGPMPDPPGAAMTSILHEQQMLVLFDTFFDTELRPLVAALGAPALAPNAGTPTSARGAKQP
jgi:hypothetical protein